ncbi:Tn3 family transposase [Streptomyces sp. NPDC002185]
MNRPNTAVQAGIPIVRYWGVGLLVSVDGLRFQVPVRTINAAHDRWW